MGPEEDPGEHHHRRPLSRRSGATGRPGTGYGPRESGRQRSVTRHESEPSRVLAATDDRTTDCAARPVTLDEMTSDEAFGNEL